MSSASPESAAEQVRASHHLAELEGLIEELLEEEPA